MATHYTLRYRRPDDQPGRAFIVADEWGTAYLFSGGQLQLRVEGEQEAASTHLARLTGHRARWEPVTGGARYTLAELDELSRAGPWDTGAWADWPSAAPPTCR